MTDAGFFKGTSADQDSRFSDKNKKLMKTMKFAENVDKKIDMKKIKLEVMKPYITSKLNALMPIEDDVIIEYVFSQLEESQYPDGKSMQIMMTGFLGKTKARTFIGELWNLLLEAQESAHGIPKELVEMKKCELAKKKEDDQRINASLHKSKDEIERTLKHGKEKKDEAVEEARRREELKREEQRREELRREEAKSKRRSSPVKRRHSPSPPASHRLSSKVEQPVQKVEQITNESKKSSRRFTEKESQVVPEPEVVKNGEIKTVVVEQAKVDAESSRVKSKPAEVEKKEKSRPSRSSSRSSREESPKKPKRSGSVLSEEETRKKEVAPLQKIIQRESGVGGGGRVARSPGRERRREERRESSRSRRRDRSYERGSNSRPSKDVQRSRNERRESEVVEERQRHREERDRKSEKSAKSSKHKKSKHKKKKSKSSKKSKSHKKTSDDESESHSESSMSGGEEDKGRNKSKDSLEVERMLREKALESLATKRKVDTKS